MPLKVTEFGKFTLVEEIFLPLDMFLRPANGLPRNGKGQSFDSAASKNPVWNSLTLALRDVSKG